MTCYSTASTDVTDVISVNMTLYRGRSAAICDTAITGNSSFTYSITHAGLHHAIDVVKPRTTLWFTKNTGQNLRFSAYFLFSKNGFQIINYHL
jgi:hypothetical protein